MIVTLNRHHEHSNERNTSSLNMHVCVVHSILLITNADHPAIMFAKLLSCRKLIGCAQIHKMVIPDCPHCVQEKHLIYEKLKINSVADAIVNSNCTVSYHRISTKACAVTELIH